MRNRTTVSCAAMLAVAILAFAMSARAHTPSCVLREDHELAKRDLNELNAKIWDFKAKHTATTGDLEDIAKAADKSKSYQGCPKCSKCPKRRRELLSQPVCLSPSEYREHLALGKEIESAKDKLKEVEHEYGDVKKDFRKAKKAYCLCDPCHAAPSPTAPSPTDVAASFDPVIIDTSSGKSVTSIHGVAFAGDSFTVAGQPVTMLDSYNATTGAYLGSSTSRIKSTNTGDYILSIAFHPLVQEDGTKTLAVASGGGWGTSLIDLFSTESGEWKSASRTQGLLAKYDNAAGFNPIDVAWNPAGTQLATATGVGPRDGIYGVNLYEYNAEVINSEPTLLTTLTLDPDPETPAGGDILNDVAQQLAFSLDGAKLATIGEGLEVLSDGGPGGTVSYVTVWATEAPYARLATVNLGASWYGLATAVTWTANNFLITGDRGGHLSVYDAALVLSRTLTDHASVHTGSPFAITSLSTSFDGSLLASADGGGNVIVWSCATWSALRVIIPSTGGYPTISLAFSPTAPLLVASIDGTSEIKMFNTEGWSSYDGDAGFPSNADE